MTALRANKDSVHAVIADFDRTLVQLFDDSTLRNVTTALRDVYACAGIYDEVLKDTSDPYALWSHVYNWMSQQYSQRKRFRIHAVASHELGKWELLAVRKATLFPGVRETLEWLRQRSVRCAIVSANSQDAIREALAFNGLADCFQVVRGRRDGEGLEDLKPSPKPLRETLAALGCSTSRAVYVGDSREDAQAAIKAGVIAIGVLTGHCSGVELTQAGAKHVVRSFAAIESLWRRLEQEWAP